MVRVGECGLSTSMLACGFPDEKPEGVEPSNFGWCCGHTIDTLSSIRDTLSERGVEVRNVLELGSFLGATTRALLNTFSAAKVTSVDLWSNKFLTEGPVRHQYRNTRGEFAIVSHPLWETFCVNMWDVRDRLFPMRMRTQDALELFSQQAGEGRTANQFDVVYIDADHSERGVASDVRTVKRLFPDTVIVGPLWQSRNVRKGLTRSELHPLLVSKDMNSEYFMWSNLRTQVIKMEPSAALRLLTDEVIAQDISQDESNRRFLALEEKSAFGLLKRMIKRNHAARVEPLIRVRPEILDVQDRSGCTLLHHAAFNDAGACFAMLVELGASTSVVSSHNETPRDVAPRHSVSERLTNTVR